MVGFAVLLFANHGTVAPAQHQAGDYRSLLDAQRRETGFPGASFAVTIDGRAPQVVSVGISDLKTGAEVTGKEPVVVASATQILLGTLTALLVEEGKLTWRVTVGELFPELRDKIDAGYRDMNLYDIACNRSGLPGGANYDEMYSRWEMPPAEARYDFMAKYALRLGSADRTTDQHGLPSWITLACMLEKATGKTLEELVKTELIEGLGMDSLGFDLPLDAKGRLFGLAPHKREGASLKRTDFSYRSRVGFYCTPLDFSKLGSLYLSALAGRSDKLSRKSALFMTKRHPRGDQSPAWRVTESGQLFFAGDSGGHYTLQIVDPSRATVVAGGVNLAGEDGGQKAAHGFADAVFANNRRR